MILIHVPRLTNRLGYTLNVLFDVLLKTEFGITSDERYFAAYNGPKLCYGPRRIGDGVHVKSCKLLLETSIEEQDTRAEMVNGQWTLFPVYGKDIDFGFDLFAATFYMISRYEEYLPHREDTHGRFPADQSLAFQKGFLEEPVVDQWATMLKEKLLERYPDLNIGERRFRMVQTIDIDAAWCYLHKGIFRTVIGTLRDLFVRHDIDEVRRRWRVLWGKEADPYDTFDYIIAQRSKVPGSHMIFFVLTADYDQYDKPSNHLNPSTRELLQHLGDHAKMGIHPGYNTLENPFNLDIETNRLEDIIHRPIVRTRYHFLRLNFPRSYRMLLHTGLRHDYTMGYPDTIGFRAGISIPYPFYDLERDHETGLTIHPFSTMDTTMQKYMRLTPDEALERYKKTIDTLKKVGGDFCFIIHNQNLCELYGWEGWKNVYEQMLDYAAQR